MFVKVLRIVGIGIAAAYLLSYWAFAQPIKRLRRYFHCLTHMFDLTPHKPGGRVGMDWNRGHVMMNHYNHEGRRKICCSCGKVF